MPVKQIDLKMKKIVDVNFPEPELHVDHYRFYSAEKSDRCLSYKFVQSVDSGYEITVPEGCVALIQPTPELVERGARLSSGVLLSGTHKLVFAVELKNGSFQVSIEPREPVADLVLVRLCGLAEGSTDEI